MTIEHKSTKDAVGTGIIATDEQEGIVEAIVSVTGVRDNVNDIIVPGAYEKTLAARKPKGVWSHDWKTPVSKALDVEEWLPGNPNLPKTLPNGEPWPADAGALWVKAKFNLNTSAGRDAFENVKFFGEDGEWSIGYSVPKGGAAEEKSAESPSGKIRRIKNLNLYEFSPVLFGAASDARTFAHSIKSMFADEQTMTEFIKALEDDASVEPEPVVTSEKEAEEELVGEEVSEETKAVREFSINVNMTGALVEQLKTLKAEIDSVLQQVLQVEEEKTMPLEIEQKSLNDAVEGLIASDLDAALVADIDNQVKSFILAVDANSEDVSVKATAVLDSVADALTEVSNVESEIALKVLAKSVGVALKETETTEPVEVAETKVTLTPDELKALLDIGNFEFK